MTTFFSKLWTFVLCAALIGATCGHIPSACAAGASSQAVQSTLNSDGFRTGFVETVYQKLLGRSATGAESAPLVAALQGGGKAWVTVVTTVAGSPDYFQKSGNNNATFANNLFQDLVGRAPDPAEETTAALDFLKGGGTTGQLAEVVADTDAFRSNWTQIFYQKLLGRAATDDEATAGATKLSNEGLTEMVSLIISSPEFFQKSGNSQDGWQNAVNQSLVGGAGGMMGNGGMNNGGMGTPTPPTPNFPNTVPTSLLINNARAPMVQALLGSPEYFANVVQRYYQKFLNRAPTPAEQQQWLGVLQGGGSSDQVMMGVLTSDEYFNRAGGTTSKFLTQVSQDLLGKTGGSSGGKNKKILPSKNDLLEMLRNLQQHKTNP